MFYKITQGIELTIETFRTTCFSDTSYLFIDHINFVLGFFGIQDIAKNYYFKDREIKTVYNNFPFWQQRAYKIIDVLGNLSLILGGLKSQPVLLIWHWSIQKIFSAEQLHAFFMRHPYLTNQRFVKITGFVAFLIGIPTTLKTCYQMYVWINRSRSTRLEEQEEHFYPPLPIKKIDVIVTVKTVSKTAHQWIRNHQ